METFIASASKSKRRQGPDTTPGPLYGSTHVNLMYSGVRDAYPGYALRFRPDILYKSMEVTYGLARRIHCDRGGLFHKNKRWAAGSYGIGGLDPVSPEKSSEAVQYCVLVNAEIENVNEQHAHAMASPSTPFQPNGNFHRFRLQEQASSG